MTKNDLIDAIAESTGVLKKDVAVILDAQDAAVTKALLAGDTVSIGGIGKLKPVERKAREGRNPQTGAVVPIPAKRDAKFSASKALREAFAG